MSLLIGEQFCSFSPKGDLFAFCNSDGVVKLFDSLTGIIKAEFSSSAHLKGICTCLEWITNCDNSLNNDEYSIQKKTKTCLVQAKSLINEFREKTLMAIGTSEGSILLYDIGKGSIYSLMQDDSVNSKVNDLCLNSKDYIYACTDDGSIFEWNCYDSKLLYKWKASKSAITALIVEPNSNYLLSASKTIAIWDLTSKTKIKTLTGHSSDIYKLISLNKNLSSKKNDEMVNDYFISTALNDRIINTWMLSSNDLGNSTTSPISSFSVVDTPIYIEVVNLNIKNNNSTVAILIVITNRGSLYFYLNELISNEQERKSNKKSVLLSNFKPLKQIIIETKENAVLKINAAFLCNANSERINSIDLDSIENNCDLSVSLLKNLNNKFRLYLIYGSSANFRIEKLNLNELSENKTRLIREDLLKVIISTATENSKIENSIAPQDLQILVPGLVGSQSGAMITNSTYKRKFNEKNQMTLEEKLDVMGINYTDNLSGDIFKRGNNLPKADNLLVLLVQGLQSNDLKTLNHVLQNKNEKVINKTVSLLSSQYVICLVKELAHRLQGHAQSGLGMIKWLKSILMIHTSYLMSYPELIGSLSKLYESINARTKLFPQLSKLQGKLQLAISQISSQANRLHIDEINDEKEEFLYYQESTSEDEQIEDDLIPSHCEEIEPDEFLFSDEEEDSTQEDIGIN